MLTIPNINGIDLEAAKPPASLYTIGRDRVRAGKGPLKIKPRDWLRANGQPLAVQTARSLYTLSTCYTSAAAAKEVARAILHVELLAENRRHADMKARLQAARDAIEVA